MVLSLMEKVHILLPTGQEQNFIELKNGRFKVVAEVGKGAADHEVILDKKSGNYSNNARRKGYSFKT